MPIIVTTPFVIPFPPLTLSGIYSNPIGYVIVSGSVGGIVFGASTVTGYVKVSGGV